MGSVVILTETDSQGSCHVYGTLCSNPHTFFGTTKPILIKILISSGHKTSSHPPCVSVVNWQCQWDYWRNLSSLSCMFLSKFSSISDYRFSAHLWLLYIVFHSMTVYYTRCPTLSTSTSQTQRSSKSLAHCMYTYVHVSASFLGLKMWHGNETHRVQLTTTVERLFSNMPSHCGVTLMSLYAIRPPRLFPLCLHSVCTVSSREWG